MECQASRACQTFNNQIWVYSSNIYYQEGFIALFISEIFGKKLKATTFFSNNQSMIILTWDCQFHACTKYIDIYYYFIHWTIKKDKMYLVYCSIEDIVANVFTKALFLPKVKYFAAVLGLSTVWRGVLEWQTGCESNTWITCLDLSYSSVFYIYIY